MSKTLVIAAFPQAFLKLCVFNGTPDTVNVAPMIHDEMFAAPQFNEIVEKIMNKYDDITTIGLLGPAIYTQRFLTDLQMKYKDNDNLTIQMMGA